MIFGCPGSQKFKQPQAETIKCASCGDEVEIWSDEAETVCPGCKKRVTRRCGQCCLDWCRYAKECVGGDAYNRYMEKTEKEKR